ncbi:TPA: hypothetical protein ACF26F_004316 [Klebsiella quasipneumoniae subsp. similipneumoniae]
MTKSTITRERLEEIVSDPMINQGSEFAMMARMALAAMDSDPVAEVLSTRPGNDTSTIDRALPVGTQLYRHAPVVPEAPDDALPPAMTFEYTGEGNFYGWGFYRDGVEVDVDTSKPFYISPVSIACIYRMEWRSQLFEEITSGKKSPSTRERLLEALFLNLKDDLGLPETANPQDCEREICRLREVDEAYRLLLNEQESK